MTKLSKRLLRLGLAVGLMLGVAGSASAVGLNYFISPANDGTAGAGDPFVASPGAASLNLWLSAAAATAGPGVLAALAPQALAATGGVTFTGFTVDPGLSGATGGFVLGSNTAALVTFSIGGGTVTFGVTPIRIGTLGISVAGVGSVTHTGDYFGLDFGTYNGDDGVVISGVPEPGTLLLLGAGMAGLALFGRRES